MKVFVYRNLRKKCWSVRALEGPDKGRVVAWKDAVMVHDAVFKVSRAGQERVVREGRKNVHAGVVGTYGEWLPSQLVKDGSLVSSERISYDPYQGPSFYRFDDGTDVHAADRVLLNGAGNVFAQGVS